MKLLLSVAAIALAAGGASASTVFHNTGSTPGQQVVTNTNGAITASAFNISTTGPSSAADFVAWCAELTQVFANGKTYEVSTATMPSYQFDRVNALVNAAYGDIDFGMTADVAGFQVAMWESLYEGAGTALDVTSGDFFVNSPAGAISAATGFLAQAAVWDGVKTYDWVRYSSDDSQDLIGVAPVPVPAAGLLAVAAFAGLGMMGRRRKSV